MGNFCKYCGKALVDGACDCAASQAQNAGSAQDMSQTYTGNAQDATQTYTGNTQDLSQAYTGNTQNVQQTPVQPQQGYVNPQQNMQYQQPQGGQAPYVQAQPSMQSQMAKQEAAAAGNLFVSTLKNPVATLENVFTTKKNTPALILGAVHLLLLFLCTTINIPGIGEYMEVGARAKIGLELLLFAGIPVAITALVAMLVGKKNNPNFTYVDSLAVFSVATVPGTVIFLVSFIMGILSASIAMILLMACYLAWVLLSVEAMNVVCNGKKDINFWILLAVHVVMIVVVMLIAKGALTSAIGSLSYGSLLGF